MRPLVHRVQAEGCPEAQGGGGGTLSNLLLGVQIVGMATFCLAEIDNTVVQGGVGGHLR